MNIFSQVVTAPVGVPIGRGFGVQYGVGHADAIAGTTAGDASSWWIVFWVLVLAYLTIGVVTAVLCILEHGEPKDGEEPVVLVILAFWPVVAAVELPLAIARRIRARREAKPAQFGDDLE